MIIPVLTIQVILSENVKDTYRLKIFIMKKNQLFLILLLFSVAIVLAQGVRIEPNTNIKIESGTTLKLDNGDLYIESDASGDASLIDKGSISYLNGEAKVHRYLSEGSWHLISPPVTNATAAMFVDDFLQYHSESSNLYTQISSINTSLNVAQAYALWTVDASPSTELFSGSTYTGNKSKSFTQNGEGFNLLGNPYPSALDWGSVSIPGTLNGAYWVFDPSIGVEGGDFREYISGGGGANTTSQYISMGQGFFVRATSGGGTITFTNNDRVHNSQSYYKNSSEIDADTELLLIKATGNNVTMQTAIRFNSNATNSIDREFDVHKIFSGNIDIPVIYTKCEDQNMAINTFPSYIGNEVMPLYFEAGISGNYSFESLLEDIDTNTGVYLEDISINYIQNLRKDPHYSFEYNTGEIKNFNIRFKDITGIDDIVSNAIHCYLAHHILHVNIDENSLSNAKIEVFNLSGQSMLQLDTSEKENDISFIGTQPIYIVKVTTDEDVYSTKVLNP